MNTRSAAEYHAKAARVLAVLPVLLAGLLTGCADQNPDPWAKCDWMSKLPDDPDFDAGAARTGHTAIVVDVTSSVRGSKAGSGGVDHSGPAAQYVEKWLSGTGTMSVAAFGGTDDIRWVAENWATGPSEKDNEENRRRRAGMVSECVAHQLAEAQAAAPRSGGTDVLDAVREAAVTLAEHRGPRRLVVLTDGLATTGCADLRRSAFEDLEIDAIAQRCRDDQELTSGTLALVDTVFVDLGRTARDQPQAAAAQTDWLGKLWNRLCQAAHPKPARPEDCVVTALPAAEPLGGKSVTRPDDPVPAFPGRTYTRAGANAFFSPESSVLLDDALREITEIAVELRNLDGARVRVFGYVDPRGGSANNHSLSQARADAVKSKLAELGVQNVTATGKGVADGCPKAETQLSTEQKLRCDRRVDILVDQVGRGR
ncbi:OmpA family protein [Strepomyces sp. STD 3.1]|uniref:OmpA family protein n=1 Tax=Streptomyces sp. NPDC058985 TaxID=3346684 RepID=UPI001F216768|nr:OmpA family protein [Streptomyces sp. STD 3.1]